MKENYFEKLIKSQKVAEEKYQEIKEKYYLLLKEKEMFPELTFDPLYSLLTYSDGQKMYKNIGKRCEFHAGYIQMFYEDIYKKQLT